METGLGASNDRLGFKRLRCRYGTSSCKNTKGCVLLHPGEEAGWFWPILGAPIYFSQSHSDTSFTTMLMPSCVMSR